MDTPPSAWDKITWNIDDDQTTSRLLRFYESLYDVIFNNMEVDGCSLPPEDIMSVEAGVWLCDSQQKELSGNFERFKMIIMKDVAPLDSEMIQWFLRETFQQLIIKVAATPSWRTFGHVLVSLAIIRDVAKQKRVIRNPQFQSDIRLDFLLFARAKFTPFILSMGGVSDIEDYTDHIRNRAKLMLLTELVVSGCILSLCFALFRAMKRFFS